MSSPFNFDLSDLMVENITVQSVDSIEYLSEGHGMAELAGSSSVCGCSCSCHSGAAFFADEDDLA